MRRKAETSIMGIDITIDHNFDQLEGLLDDIKAKAAIQAARHSINRTLLTVRQKSIERIRKNLNVKVGTLRKKHLVIDRAKGGNLFTLEGQIKYNTTPIPMLEFVQGSKQPRPKKGIPIAKRKPLKARIRPGKTIKLRKAFIADAKTKQVFKGGKGRGFKKQGVTSVGFVFNKPTIRKQLIALAQKRFSELFVKDFEARVSGAVKSRNTKGLRIR